MIELIQAAFGGMIFGGFGAWSLMKFGNKLGLNDIPNHRSSHTTAVPKGGGIGILIAFVAASLLLSLPIWLWLPASLIALISFFGGDKNTLTAKQRLFVQFCFSLIFVLYLLHYKQAEWWVYPLLCVPVSVFIVGTANFYNFMDGIDGIAGVTGVVAFLLLWGYTFQLEVGRSYQLICIVMMCSCLGFLFLNFPKAKVFLGDVGSVSLGFVFACLILTLSQSPLDFIVMAGFITPFFMDELSTMIVRVRNGDSLTQPHRKHLYQLLANEFGIKHWKISLTYGAVQLLIGLSVIALRPKGVMALFLLYFSCCGVFILLSVILRKEK